MTGEQEEEEEEEEEETTKMNEPSIFFFMSPFLHCFHSAFLNKWVEF